MIKANSLPYPKMGSDFYDKALIGKEGVLESGLTATPCQYVPWEKVAELEQLWASRQGSRQFLIGE